MGFCCNRGWVERERKRGKARAAKVWGGTALLEIFPGQEPLADCSTLPVSQLECPGPKGVGEGRLPNLVSSPPLSLSLSLSLPRRCRGSRKTSHQGW